MACRLSLGSPAKPGDPIPVSTEAAGSFEGKVKTAVAQAQQDGRVAVAFSEEELTSYVALQLQAQTDLPISSPQIYLRDDKVQFFADYDSGSVTLPVRVIFEPQVDASGNARLKLESIDMGAIAVPDAVQQRLQEEIDRAFLQALDNAGDQFTVETLSIQDGQLNLQGVKR